MEFGTNDDLVRMKEDGIREMSQYSVQWWAERQKETSAGEKGVWWKRKEKKTFFLKPGKVNADALPPPNLLVMEKHV